MRTLKTSEAAALLNVSANTLRTWERRFGYPQPRRSPGRHRLYVYAEICALRAALEEGLSISSAVSVASEALDADGHAVVTALAAFQYDEADRAMEMSLGLRSMERTVDDVLLPALAEIRRRKGLCSAAWDLAAQWAGDWLSRAHRLTPSGSDPRGVLIADASDDPLDPSGPYTRALELCCARRGHQARTSRVRAVGRLSELVGALAPAAVVIAGGDAHHDEVARWAYAVRQEAGDVPFLLFHRGFDTGLNGSRTRTLPRSPVEAAASISVLLRSPPPSDVPTALPARARTPLLATQGSAAARS
jgi:MerR family transcriptional regulator, light-induced transcriptional regulator